MSLDTERRERETETRRQVELLNEAARESVSGCPRCDGLGWSQLFGFAHWRRCRFCKGFGQVRCYDGEPQRR
jgi:hypothetical protein